MATADVKSLAVGTATTAGAALGQLVSGLGTAVLAPFVLLWLVLAPGGVRVLHALAGMERVRLARWGPEVIAPAPPPTRLRAALADPTTRRELLWLVRHLTLGLPLGLLGFVLPVLAVRDAAFPLYWRLAPKDATATSIGVGVAHSWPDALAVCLLGVGWIAIMLGLTPGMARLQASPGRRLLSAGPDTDLSLRVAELTATRAAALDAHATELRRIERSLHDGTQNRIVTVTVLLGAARRMVARDPAGRRRTPGAGPVRRRTGAGRAADGLPQHPAAGAGRPGAGRRAHRARGGVRGALPVDVEVPRRCAASVEATAYFVVAEALTNIAKHSGAPRATVTVRAAGGTAPAADHGRRPRRRRRARRLRPHRHPPPDRGARRHPPPDQPTRRPDDTGGGSAVVV